MLHIFGAHPRRRTIFEKKKTKFVEFGPPIQVEHHSAIQIFNEICDQSQ